MIRKLPMWVDRATLPRLSDGLSPPSIRAGLTAVLLILPAMTFAQPAGRTNDHAGADSLTTIDAEYQQQRARIDRERIDRLTRLAAAQKAGEAEVTYLEIFRFAIASERYVEAEPAADLVIRTGASGQEVALLAQLVKIIAEAERGDYEGSLRDLKAYADARPAGAPIPPRTLLMLGEAYFRRLVRGQKFDLAREVCDLVARKAESPAIRDHFSGYRRRLDLVGRPAPVIRGVDVDGAEVKIADLKGKVVLVVFWATWCNPCVERIPMMNRALELHEKDGFAILGVNLDTGPDRARLVRQFVVDFGVPWPNVLSGERGADIADAYGVAEIPANVLIDRDGKVITLDLGGADLLRTVSQAIGSSNQPRGSTGR